MQHLGADMKFLKKLSDEEKYKPGLYSANYNLLKQLNDHTDIHSFEGEHTRFFQNKSNVNMFLKLYENQSIIISYFVPD